MGDGGARCLVCSTRVSTMTCSPNQMAANQQNAARSIGHLTSAGNERSRRNSLKHGLTGPGIVLPHEDEAAMESRFAEFEADLRLRGGVDRFLVRRAALLSVRLDRSATQESARLSTEILMIQAQRAEIQSNEVNRLLGEITLAPSRIPGELIARPDGVDGLTQSLRTLQGEVAAASLGTWSSDFGPRLDALLDRDPGGPTWRSGQLASAVGGDLVQLKPGEVAELDDTGTRAWARNRLIDLIDAEIRKLDYWRSQLPASMTAPAFEPTPNPASDLAMGLAFFDTSKEEILARRYEATTERTLLRIVREVRRTAAQVSAESVDPDDRDEDYGDELGSFFPELRSVDSGKPQRWRRPVPEGFLRITRPEYPEPGQPGLLTSAVGSPPPFR